MVTEPRNRQPHHPHCVKPQDSHKKNCMPTEEHPHTRNQPKVPTWVIPTLGLCVAAVLVTQLLLWSLLQLKSLLIALTVSLFLSFGLEPAVYYLTRKGVRRVAATTMVFIAVLLAVVAFGALTLPPLTQEFGALGEYIPEWLSQVDSFINTRLGSDINLQQLASQVFSSDSELLGSVGTGVIGVGGAALEIVLQLCAVGLFTFYMLAHGPEMRRVVLSQVKPSKQNELLQMWEIAVNKTGGYMYSRAVLAVISAAYTYLLLTVFGVPYALTLSVWTGVMSQTIPILGTYLAAGLPTLLALTVSPKTATLVLIGLILYQQIENFWLAPKIAGKTMKLHPAVAFAAVVAGWSLLGIPGMVLALPVAAILQSFLSTYVTQHQVEHTELGAENPHHPQQPKNRAPIKKLVNHLKDRRRKPSGQ